MSAFVRASLKAGLETDGWLSSQALLIWGSDEDGQAKDLIIDGEHRWRVAQELGFLEGPMVVLHNLKESRAKGLTIKMNQKRGTFESEKLAELVRELLLGEDSEAVSLDVGLTENEIARLVSGPEEAAADAVAASTSGGGHRDEYEDRQRGPRLPEVVPEYQQVKMVQLLFDDNRFAEFNRRVQELGKAYGLRTVSDTVMEALRHV